MRRGELARAVRHALQTCCDALATGEIGRQRNKLRLAAGALAGALLMSAPTFVSAQSNVDGYVYGTGQPGTEVRIKSPATGAVRTATVTSTGTFRVPSVPPGRYEVTYTDAEGQTVTREVFVTIGAGASVDSLIDTIVVTGDSVRPVDMTKTEIVTTLSSEQVTSLPVVRDIQQVALLAPGVIQGDAGFQSQSNQPLASFGGASPGENTYYINGFNITDFRNFLGGATVPFEMYDQFELRTGGYSAEFGRSLGGVINAVTKRGTNEFKWGTAAYWSPDSLTARRPSSYYVDENGVRTLRTDNSQDYRSNLEVNLQASGPIIEDKLFFYALAVARTSREDDAIGTTSLLREEDDAPFFGGKLDWQITDNHAMEYTFLRDERTIDIEGYHYDGNSRTLGSRKSIGEKDLGGSTHILRYTGTLFDNLTLSALYGHGERDEATRNRDANTGNPCTAVLDARGGQSNPLSCWDGENLQTLDTTDERDAFRLDLIYQLGNHTLRAGYDYEENISDTNVIYEGGAYYRYSNATPGSTFNGGVVPDGVTEVARERFYSVQGKFKEKLSALYIEDQWQVTDRLLLSLGLRNETLENFNRDGEEFLDFGSQLTPRFGFSFDLLGDGRTKLFGNAGRYTMPIATNTNIRFAGGEYFTEQYYVLDGVNIDGTPILGAAIGGRRTLADGSVPVPSESVDRHIKPMYQDEFILGIQSAITDRTTAGLKITHRDLVRAVEDSAFTDADGNYYYFLFNPGRDVTLQNPDGSWSTISAEDLGYPEAKRTYWAAELSFDHQVGSTLRLGGSYTWSHTYGNFEGVFHSDVQQDDAGITISYDTPGLALYTSGDLPNDRRHIFKLYGSYSPIPELMFSFNASANSGRPKNARGNCPVDIDPDAYEQDCFFVGGRPSPRGSAGRLPWVYNVDLGVRYMPQFGPGQLTIGLDVVNLFNFDTETRIQEVAQQAGDENAPLEPSYGIPVYYQLPRSARLSVRWDF